MHDPYVKDKPNPRNLIGILIFIFGLSLYAFAAAAIGDHLVDFHLSVQMIYYCVAGTFWILPSRKLFQWMAANRNP